LVSGLAFITLVRPGEAQSPALPARVEALERRVQSIQAVIQELLKRPGATDAQGESVASSVPPQLPPPPAKPAPPLVAQAQPPAPAAAPTAQREPPAAAASVPETAPGQFEVDAEAAELERALYGQAELQPSLEYVHREADTPGILTVDGSQFIASNNVRRDELTTALGLRVGLPYDAQFELSLPARYVDQSEVATTDFSPRSEASDSGFGLGDVTVGLAKTLLREGAWWPDLVGWFRWDTDTGKRRDDDLFLGGYGFNELLFSLNAVKHQDPLAFLAGISYETAFEKDDERPGDEIDLTIGTVLAASPETSLRFVFEQAIMGEAEFAGQDVDGSDMKTGTLTIGASSILERGMFLDAALGIGLTDEAADYSVIVSLPIRFDVPMPSLP
jgi:hypothetical protein